jgi:hypothetical protein
MWEIYPSAPLPPDIFNWQYQSTYPPFGVFPQFGTGIMLPDSGLLGFMFKTSWDNDAVACRVDVYQVFSTGFDLCGSWSVEFAEEEDTQKSAYFQLTAGTYVFQAMIEDRLPSGEDVEPGATVQFDVYL